LPGREIPPKDTCGTVWARDRIIEPQKFALLRISWDAAGINEARGVLFLVAKEAVRNFKPPHLPPIDPDKTARHADFAMLHALTCDYCRSPITGSSFLGRTWPDRAPAHYCCYGCLSVGEAQRNERIDEKPPRRFDGFTLRLGIGLLVAGQSMIFGLAINLNEQTPLAVKLGVQGFILAGTLLVLGLLGPRLLGAAVSEIRRGRLTIEALFLLTMAGAMVASLQSFVSGSGPVYFEVVTVLLVVYSLGKAIGARSRAAALASADRWKNSLSQCRLVDGGLVEVAAIRPGDIVEVRPGEAFAVDGIIREGVGFVGEAPVSGEPFAIVRRPGDCVLAGAVSHDATFRIEATAPGAARQIDRLIAAVEQARAAPTSLQALADRLARIFFPILVIAAFATFAVWTYLAGWQRGVFNAMAVLLVACPCALGLATPIVIWSALNRLAERGLIANSGDIIERLASVDRVVFDKTGTLTDERFAIVDIVTKTQRAQRARILGWLSIVQEQCAHPIARPFAELPRPFPADAMPRVVSLRVVPGCGIEAELADQDEIHHLRIGRPEWIGGTAGEVTLLATAGHRIYFEIDGRLAGVALVSERLRDSAPEALADLRSLGLPVSVLTGDTTERARALGLPAVEGNLLPDDKRQRLLEQGGKPLMIGDGINDAAALAVAHAGIALSLGTDLANGAATATLYHGDLRVIPWAIAASRDAVRAVRRNLWRAAAYNVVGISLAGCGILHPVAAALLMVVSSLLVAWSSVRVGSSTITCRHVDDDEEKRPRTVGLRWRAALHGQAFALQGVIALWLLSLTGFSAVATLLAFGLIGAAMAILWLRWSRMHRGFEMAICMLTFGNLGMLLGWWADNGFGPLRDRCCGVDSLAGRPWMWIGMLLFANLAMIFLPRRVSFELPHCRTAMFTGGNLGMVLGMFAGGWLAGLAEMHSVAAGAFLAFLGMSAGMIAGMLCGTAITQRLISALRFGNARPSIDQPNSSSSGSPVLSGRESPSLVIFDSNGTPSA
jgi:heavy metal translocating P-type ATPase